MAATYTTTGAGNAPAVIGAVKNVASAVGGALTKANSAYENNLGSYSPFAKVPVTPAQSPTSVISNMTPGGSTPAVSTGVANHTKQSIISSGNGLDQNLVNADIARAKAQAQSGGNMVDSSTTTIPPAQPVAPTNLTPNGTYNPNGNNNSNNPAFTSQTTNTSSPTYNSDGSIATPGTSTDASGNTNTYNQPAISTTVNNTPSASAISSGSSALNVPNGTPNPSVNSSLLATANSYMTPPSGYTTDASGNLVAPAPTGGSDERSQILNKILGDTGALGQEGNATNQLNTAFGVDQKQQDYIDAFNAYNSKKVQYSQMENNYLNSNQGISNGASNEEFQIMQRNHNADLANLSVIATNAQGNYTGAMDIVKRKIDAEFAPIQTEVDNLGKFITTNNADLTQSQQTQLENQRFLLQTNMTNLISAKTAAHQFALQQGVTDPAVLNSIDAATTVAGAYEAVGGNSAGVPTAPAGQAKGTDQDISTNVAPQNQPYIDHTSDGVAYVDQGRLENMTPYQKQVASQQYAAAGVRVLDSTDVGAMTTIDEAKQTLDTFEAVSNKLLSSGTFGRIAGYTTNQLAQLTQSNPDWRQFTSLRAGLIKAVQGAAAGAPGLRVTGAELSNAADALPTSFDNKESAQKAVDTFRSLLNTNRDILLRGNAPASSSGGGDSSGDSGGGLYSF